MSKKKMRLIIRKFCLTFTIILCLIFLGDTTSSNIHRKEHDTVIISLNNKDHQLKTENNATVKALYQRLPLRMNMHDLNGNEKYYNLPKKLPSNDKKIKNIKKGDVLLYNSNCIVIFYKDIKTSYKYTRIGHIKDFSKLATNFSADDITVVIKKQ